MAGVAGVDGWGYVVCGISRKVWSNIFSVWDHVHMSHTNPETSLS